MNHETKTDENPNQYYVKSARIPWFIIAEHSYSDGSKLFLPDRKSTIQRNTEIQELRHPQHLCKRHGDQTAAEVGSAQCGLMEPSPAEDEAQGLCENKAEVE